MTDLKIRDHNHRSLIHERLQRAFEEPLPFVKADDRTAARKRRRTSAMIMSLAPSHDLS